MPFIPKAPYNAPLIFPDRKNFCFIVAISFCLYLFLPANIQCSVADTSGSSYLLTGADKIVNTYVFTGNARIDLNLGIGKLLIKQNYTSTILRTSTSAIRDDEALTMDFYSPLSDNVSVLAGQNWLLSSDTRSIGLNKLERLRGMAGLRYAIDPAAYLELRGGFERNRQISIAALGPYFSFNGILDRYNYDGYLLNSSLGAEYVRFGQGSGLKSDRTNSDFSFSGSVRKQYDFNNALRFDVSYDMVNRDFISTTGASGLYSVESRLEDRLDAMLDADFMLMVFPTNVNISLKMVSVDRSYKIFEPDVSLTGIMRSQDVLNLSLLTSSSYISPNFRQKIGIAIDMRDETNNISNKFGINSEEETILRTRENQRDNATARSRLFAVSSLDISPRDTLNGELSLSVQRYDTPSRQNYDDRDELSLVAGLEYSHRFSDLLSASLSFDMQLHHLVFLKARRSALNNWNRIIRFGPKVYYRSKYVSLRPSFEVLANYTVYDFEEFSSGINSFSFRQISYRDSIGIRLSESVSIQSGIVMKYYERGILYWDSFSETPQNGNFEQFTKLMLIYGDSYRYSFGVGARYYRLDQKKLSSGTGGGFGSSIDYISLGPEALLRYIFDSGSSISFEGWYEIQSTGNENKRYVPNFFLTATLIL